ncbi:TetR/AcrR family transcriptional regulator [Paraflavitalea soli]|uniref:TetR/AcrR family transcriptional regulator n=1 Tax=Paraflavitalea soli TaxID=2315862 RepID=A0A3B7MQZ7_9BACT|nr:TetR/AcrR family transcriptional regulator [Paraflavitalea soli]AXY73011.1 TetR/AcrR family transcriptional regulator [Paraflavitalea soli]
MREQITQKAAALFTQYSVRSITMDEIAGSMGISKKTLYTWFIDKNELVETVYATPLQQLEADCTTTIRTASNAIQEIFLIWQSVKQTIGAMNETLLHDLQKYHHTAFERYTNFKKGFLFQVLLSNIKRGQSEQLYRAQIIPELIAGYQVSITGINTRQEINQQQLWPQATINEQLILHYLHGLATAKGIRLIEKYTKEYAEA